MANLVEVIVGTYEEFLLGYKVENLKSDGKTTLTQSFATRSHSASVRCVALNKTYLASGGADDRIIIYDMKSRKEIQTLIHHEGTVNALAISPDGSHILTGSDDGKMCAIRIGSWLTEGVWKKAHSGSPVTHICCHPSGKLALTLGNDLTLRTWNLIKGRLAYTTNMKYMRTPDCISWSPDGEHFTITGMRILEIWSVKTAGIVKEIKCDSRPISLCWLNVTKVLVGHEDGKVMIVDIESDATPVLHEAHKQRVKGVAFVNNVLATASSSGEISLWTVDLEENEIVKVTSTNIGCRPTCIALLDLTQFGDDYVLKLEAAEEVEEEIVIEKPKPKNKIKSVGNVIVEIEDGIRASDDEHFAAMEKKLSKQPKKKNKKGKVESNVDDDVKKKNRKRMNETRKSSGFEEESISENDATNEPVTKKKKPKNHGNKLNYKEESISENDATNEPVTKKKKPKNHGNKLNLTVSQELPKKKKKQLKRKSI